MSLGSFIAGYSFNSIGGSATFRLFAAGALVFLVAHVLVQKIYARFAGSIGKEDAAGHQKGSVHQEVAYIASGLGSTLHLPVASEDDKRANAAQVLLSAGEDGFRDIPLK